MALLPVTPPTMRDLTASDVLALWERGAASDPALRGVLLLAATGEMGAPDQCARLPVGQRDARLLELRERLFGPQLASLASCPACRSADQNGRVVNFSYCAEMNSDPTQDLFGDEHRQRMDAGALEHLLVAQNNSPTTPAWGKPMEMPKPSRMPNEKVDFG